MTSDIKEIFDNRIEEFKKVMKGITNPKILNHYEGFIRHLEDLKSSILQKGQEYKKREKILRNHIRDINVICSSQKKEIETSKKDLIKYHKITEEQFKFKDKEIERLKADCKVCADNWYKHNEKQVDEIERLNKKVENDFDELVNNQSIISQLQNQLKEQRKKIIEILDNKADEHQKIVWIRNLIINSEVDK